MILTTGVSVPFFERLDPEFETILVGNIIRWDIKLRRRLKP